MLKPGVLLGSRYRLDERIARDGAESVVLEVHRSLPPVLDRLRAVAARHGGHG